MSATAIMRSSMPSRRPWSAAAPKRRSSRVLRWSSVPSSCITPGHRRLTRTPPGRAAGTGAERTKEQAAPLCRLRPVAVAASAAAAAAAGWSLPAASSSSSESTYSTASPTSPTSLPALLALSLLLSSSSLISSIAATSGSSLGASISSPSTASRSSVTSAAPSMSSMSESRLLTSLPSSLSLPASLSLLSSLALASTAAAPSPPCPEARPGRRASDPRSMPPRAPPRPRPRPPLADGVSASSVASATDASPLRPLLEAPVSTDGPDAAAGAPRSLPAAPLLLPGRSASPTRSLSAFFPREEERFSDFMLTTSLLVVARLRDVSLEWKMTAFLTKPPEASPPIFSVTMTKSFARRRVRRGAPSISTDMDCDAVRRGGAGGLPSGAEASTPERASPPAAGTGAEA
mmetsp:Transcript_26452/g.99487  ORF Transcript_26452/g.99487 Transcript_26452/m.99487 type:complete len:404 (-) Transcript_26452:374-1585(-)